jgi:hypothetical protein
MASPNAGGFVEITINGVPYSAVGDVEVEESNKEKEAVTNQDGTVQVTIKPKPYKVMLTLRDRQGASIIQALMEAEQFDLTSREPHMRRTVFMTNAFATGVLKRNTATGEIDGLEVCGASMRIVSNQS